MNPVTPSPLPGGRRPEGSKTNPNPVDRSLVEEGRGERPVPFQEEQPGVHSLNVKSLPPSAPGRNDLREKVAEAGFARLYGGSLPDQGLGEIAEWFGVADAAIPVVVAAMTDRLFRWAEGQSGPTIEALRRELRDIEEGC